MVKIEASNNAPENMMQALTHSSSITESMAMAMIFDASRANPTRKTWQGIFAGVYYVATFQAQADGTHMVTVKNENRETLATAVVDAADC